MAPASKLESIDYQIASDSEPENTVASTLPATLSKVTSSSKAENLEDYVNSSDSEEGTPIILRAPHARQTSNFESLQHNPHKPSPIEFPVIEDDSQVLKGQIDFTVISSSSEEEMPVCNRNPPVHKGLDPTIYFSATEEHQQAPFRKYIPPPAKFIRSKLASRLDTLLHRQQSNRVIWLHKKYRTRESGVPSSFSPASIVKDDHEEQTFRIKSIRLPSPTFIRRFSSQVCLLASTADQSTNMVIIFIPSSTLTDEQLNLLRDTRGQRSLEVSLFKPWYELNASPALCPTGTSRRSIFAPFMATFRPSSESLLSDELIHLSVECDCLKKGSTEACPRRYGPQRPNHDSLLWTAPSEPATSSFLVLHKSLCWFQHKLRFVFIFNFTGGFLAAFMVPTSVFAAESSGVRRTSSPLSNLGPGCVCDVSDLHALPQAGDDGLAATILEHAKSVREIVGPLFEFDCSDDSQLHIPECLLSDKASEETPHTLVPFFLLQSGKGQMTLKSSLFTEQLTSPPFSSQLSPGSRCTLKCVLLHEFPAGSVSAEKVVSAVSGVCGEYSDLVPFSASSSTLLLVFLLGFLPPIRILICTREAATPMAVLNSNLVNFPISLDQQDTCWTRLMIYGVIFFEDFFLADALSRIEVIEASPISEHCSFSLSTPTAQTHLSLPPLPSSMRLSASLFATTSGTIVSVDSECSQLWPLCASCLSEDLAPCPLDPGSHLQVQSTSTSKDALLCGRCLARLCRPYYAVEVIVEVQFDSIALPSPLSADSEEAHRIHLCMESAHVSDLLGLTASKLHQASCLDPSQLIGRDPGVISGVIIHLPSDPFATGVGPSCPKSSSSSSSSFKRAHSFIVGMNKRLISRVLAAAGSTFST